MAQASLHFTGLFHSLVYQTKLTIAQRKTICANCPS